MIVWRVAVTILVTFFAVAAVREAAPPARLFLIALAGATAAAPFAVQAIQHRRRQQHTLAQAAALDARATRQLHIREDIQRVIAARATEIDRLRVKRAGATPDQWRALVRSYALSTVLPAISHGVTPAERERLVVDAIGAVETFLAARAQPRFEPTPTSGRDVETLVDSCAAAVAAARWESWVTPGDIVAARRGGVRILFFCVGALARIDKALIDTAHARCEASGVGYAVIVSAQTYAPAAVAYAKSRSASLIRPEQIPRLLDWALLRSSRRAA